MPIDLQSGFQVGQAIGQGSTLGAFVKQLTARANVLFEQQAQAAGEFEVQRRLLPLKEESELRLEGAKAKMAREGASEFFRTFMGSGGSGGGGAFPPGSTAALDVGGVKINMPLNRELSPDEARTISASGDVRNTVERAKEIVRGVGGGAVIGSKLPAWLLGGVRAGAQRVGMGRGFQQAELVQQVNDQLRSFLPFAFGGKQLTKPEEAAITRLLVSIGKDDARIERDLERFAGLFEYTSELVRTGQMAAKSPAQILAEMGIEVEASAYKDLLNAPSQSRTLPLDERGLPIGAEVLQ